MTTTGDSKKSDFRSWDEILAAERPPRAWSGGGQIPWHDSGFSERMLTVHLDQSTHMASRKLDVIDTHVDWLVRLLAEKFPAVKPPTVLDVGCGPGLYCHGLARRGVKAVGFDFAPAPLRWARRQAESEDLDCVFLKADLTALPDDIAADSGPFQAITIWYCEFQSFRPSVARDFLRRLASLLAPEGLLIVEYQPSDAFVKEDGSQWSAETASVMCDEPHLWLQEFGWDADLKVETHVHWILEQESGRLSCYTQCHQVYTDAELVAILSEAGLGDCLFYPPITGVDPRHEFPLVIARSGNVSVT